MKKLNWGMLGTGWIAHEMGEALKRVMVRFMPAVRQVWKAQKNMQKNLM